MILAANLLTDAFSTSHLTDIYKTKHNYNEQQHKNLNNHARTPLTYSQTKANKTRAWFSGRSAIKTNETTSLGSYHAIWLAKTKWVVS